jgi:hypothetical protein
LGQIEEARAAIAEVLRRNPDATMGSYGRTLAAFKHAKDGERFLDALRKAGMPE